VGGEKEPYQQGKLDPNLGWKGQQTQVIHELLNT